MNGAALVSATRCSARRQKYSEFCVIDCQGWRPRSGYKCEMLHSNSAFLNALFV